MTEFQISRSGEQSGPHSQEDIELALNEGTLSPQDFAWCEGMEAWESIADLFKLETLETIELVPADDPRVATAAGVAGSPAPPPTVKVAGVPRVTPRVVPVQSRNFDYAPSGPSVGKIVGGSIVGLLVLGLLAIPWLIGKAVESGLAELSGSKRPGIGLVSKAHQRGYLTSQAKLRLALGDESAEQGVGFHSEIAHGPIASTPDGLKFVSAYTYTTLDRSDLDEETKTTLFKIWGNEEPFEIRSKVSYGGVASTAVSVSPANYQDGENSVSFKGGEIQIEHGSDAEKAIAGSMDLKATTMVMGGTTIEMDPSGGSFDYAEGEHFDADITLGKMQAESADGGFNLRINAPTYTADMEGIGSDSLIMTGGATLTMPYIEADLGSTNYRIERVSFDQSTSKTGSTLESVGGFKIGRIGISEDPDQPGMAGMFAGPLAGGMEFESGMRGVEVDAMNAFYTELREVQALLQDSTALQEARTEAGLENTPEAGEEIGRKAFAEVMRKALGLVRPGSQFYLNQALSDQLQINLVLGFTGNQALTEMKTGREIVTALGGTLKMRVDPALMENPMIGGMIGQQAQAGFGTLDEDGFSFEGELVDGVILIGGQPTPILEMFGPMLDQPLDWEAIFAMMAEGAEEA